MSPEWWLEAYESAVEFVADIEGIDLESASRSVDGYMESDPKYLNDFITEVVECYKIS